VTTVETLSHDPFATKGIEYLVVLAYLGVLPLFWRYLNGAPRLAPERVLAAQRSVLSGWFQLPAWALFHQGHTWAAPFGARRFRLGLDDFAQKLLGQPAAITLPVVGDRLRQNGPAWSLDVGGHRFDLPAPISGRVIARNDEVVHEPGLINSDPYGKGWLLEVETPRWGSGTRSLFRGARASSWLAKVEGALRLRMNPEVGAVLQDGGVPVPGIARALDAERWDELARELLASH
jgi:glycine cleavage system H lipoate-binding protein